MEKVVYNETIEELELPELTPWEQIVGRPTSLKDISSGDYNKLQEIDDLGELAWEDVATEIFIATNAITETKIATDAITTPKIKAGAITSAKLTTGELITLSAQIKDAIISNAKISDLSADKINAGTLTGRTVRTASSGKRVEMVSNPTNQLKFYDEDGKVTTVESFYVGAKNYYGMYYHTGDYLEFGGDFVFKIQTSHGNMVIKSTGFDFSNSLIPNSNNTYNLGSSSLRWAHIYATNGTITTLGVTSLSVATSFILPSGTATGSCTNGAMRYNTSSNRSQVCHEGTWRDFYTD
jgi:hypothetical protein